MDTGALIALEHGDQGVASLVSRARARKTRILVPTSALAQAWRGGPRSAPLARALDGWEVDVLTERRAKEVGVRLALRDVSDIADAHVVCCAIEHGAVVATSDPADIRGLLDPRERLALIPV